MEGHRAEAGQEFIGGLKNIMNNTLKYSLTMRKNLARPEDTEKAYASLQLNGVMDINALATHMHDHGSIYSKGTIVGVVTDMCGCIKEAIKEGNAIELGELGRFTPSITSEGAEATEATETEPARTAMENFTADNIKDLHVNYELGSGMVLKRDDYSFEYVTTRKAQAATKKAQKKGETSADWTEPDDGNEEP